MKWYMDEDGLPVAIDLSPVQVQITLRNPTFQFERPPSNESKMISLRDLNLNLHTLQDLCSGIQRENRNNLLLNQIGFMPNEESTLGTDLLAQKLNDPSHTLALASKMVPESCKRGLVASTIRSQEGEPSSEPSPLAMDLSREKSPEENRSDQSTKPRTRKRQNASKKEEASKKQQLETKKVEAASLNWLHPDK
ncbi:hypothetical protein LINGRAHAP2_LOCUS5115 [Linum grandiflorum]